MHKLTLYFSEDGKEFPTAEECLAWEEKISTLPDSIIFYDKNMKMMVVDEVPGEDAIMYGAYNHCKFIRVLDMPCYKNDLDFLYNYWGFFLPDADPGVYIYDEKNNEWRLATKDEIDAATA